MAKARRSSRPSSKQGGGTFLGIVLGLIVGLAIAVVVALYITRTPAPFVAKSSAPPATSDTSAGQAPFDPNRALAGKSPGQPVPQAAQPAPPNTAPGQTSQQSQSSGMLQEPQIVEVPSSGNAAQSAPQPTTPVAPGTPSAPANTASAKPGQPNGGTATAQAKPSGNEANTGYFLQVGAYKTSQDAEQQRARLALQGFESKVTQRDAGGITYYRVRIGPFAKFDDMNSTRQRLSDSGVDTAVIRFSKQ
jgi:cell division protein FtsN